MLIYLRIRLSSYLLIFSPPYSSLPHLSTCIFISIGLNSPFRSLSESTPSLYSWILHRTHATTFLDFQFGSQAAHFHSRAWSLFFIIVFSPLEVQSIAERLSKWENFFIVSSCFNNHLSTFQSEIINQLLYFWVYFSHCWFTLLSFSYLSFTVTASADPQFFGPELRHLQLFCYYFVSVSNFTALVQIFYLSELPHSFCRVLKLEWSTYSYSESPALTIWFALSFRTVSCLALWFKLWIFQSSPFLTDLQIVELCWFSTKAIAFKHFYYTRSCLFATTPEKAWPACSHTQKLIVPYSVKSDLCFWFPPAMKQSGVSNWQDLLIFDQGYTEPTGTLIRFLSFYRITVADFTLAFDIFPTLTAGLFLQACKFDDFCCYCRPLINLLLLHFSLTLSRIRIFFTCIIQSTS